MKISAVIFVFLIMTALQESQACSLASNEIFKPSLTEWKMHPGPKQQNKNSEGEYWEKAPAPIIKVTKIIRGSSSDGTSCSDAGTLKLEVSLPQSSTYNISEFGIYFRVKRGKLPDEIFPDVPLKFIEQNGRYLVLLSWLDGNPKKQFPLDLEVEAFLVTNSLNIGQSTEFKIQAGIGG